jgi:hypothetical protein
MAKTTSNINYVTSRRPRTGDPIVPGSIVYDSLNRITSIGYYVGFNDDVETISFSYSAEGHLTFKGVEYRNYELDMWNATLKKIDFELASVTKFAYDAAFNLEYLGEAKIQATDSENKFFLQKFIYDPAFNLIEILNATNDTSLGAAALTIDVSSDPNFILINLPNGGDFSEVNAADFISVKTVNNEFNLLLIYDTDQNTNARIRKSDVPSEILSTIVDETNTVIASQDVLVRLEDDSTKELNKRRWDHRERYIYA